MRRVFVSGPLPALFGGTLGTLAGVFLCALLGRPDNTVVVQPREHYRFEAPAGTVLEIHKDRITLVTGPQGISGQRLDVAQVTSGL